MRRRFARSYGGRSATGVKRRLDRRVTFLQKAAGTNAFNESDPGWSDMFTVKCARYPAPGMEKYANQENAQTSPTIIEVRGEARTEALTQDNAARIDGKVYEIVSLEQPERGSNIIISAVAHGD